MKLPRYTIIIIALIFLIGSFYLSNNQELQTAVNNPMELIDPQPNDYAPRTNETIQVPNFIADYNLRHILEGNINRNGEATGFHHAPSSKDKTTKVIEVVSQPNNCGVYKAKVQVKGKAKKAYSTMFPDKYTEKQIVVVLTKAYTDGTKNNPTRTTFTTKGDDCLSVFVVLDSNKKIITSYPIY